MVMEHDGFLKLDIIFSSAVAPYPMYMILINNIQVFYYNIQENIRCSDMLPISKGDVVKYVLSASAHYEIHTHKWSIIPYEN